MHLLTTMVLLVSAHNYTQNSNSENIHSHFFIALVDYNDIVTVKRTECLYDLITGFLCCCCTEHKDVGLRLTPISMAAWIGTYL